MLDLNTQHPRFDIALEVLCSLPPAIDGQLSATLEREVRNDLGIPRMSEFTVIMDTLKGAGHSISRRNVFHAGRALELDRTHSLAWSLAVAQEYWDAVNGAAS